MLGGQQISQAVTVHTVTPYRQRFRNVCGISDSHKQRRGLDGIPGKREICRAQGPRTHQRRCITRHRHWQGSRHVANLEDTAAPSSRGSHDRDNGYSIPWDTSQVPFNPVTEGNFLIIRHVDMSKRSTKQVGVMQHTKAVRFINFVMTVVMGLQ